MSTPVTSLSGFNGIDFNVILNAVMQQASQPLNALQTKQTNLSTEKTTYGVLATKLGALETAATTLSTTGGVVTYAATISDTTAIAVSPTSTAAAGNYNIVVNSLAQAQSTASTSTSPDANTTAVATGGSITIGGVVVTVAASLTLQGLANQINATAGMTATASVVQTAPGAFRLMLTGNNTGAANAFTVTNALTGGLGVTFAGNTVAAADASLTVNGLAITSASNTLTAAIPGSTLTLLRADPLKTVAVSVASDDSALTSKIQSFVSAYNDLVKFVGTQTAAAANGQQDTLAREPVLSQMRSDLRSVLGAAYGTATFKKLAEVGIGFTTAGTMSLDTTVLTSALQQSRSSVVSLFAGTATVGAFTNGAFGGIQKTIHDYTQFGGFIGAAQTQLQTSIATLTNQMNDLQARLIVQRNALQREYTAAEMAMSQLKTQSGNLASFSATLNTLS